MELSQTDINKIPLTEDLLFASHYTEVLGSSMHYLDEGKGDPILFLHGIPTWSYLWRNIIPAISDLGRCIAPDLIGMGKSDKPNISYRVFDHIRYIEAFIEKLDLKNITLVLHGWGSVIGFDIAMRYPEKFKGIAFIEAFLKPLLQSEQIALPVQEMMGILNLPDRGKDIVLHSDYLVTKLIMAGTVRKLTEKELSAYKEPFATEESRKLLWQFVQDAPIYQGAEDVVELINNYQVKLQQSSLEKLMLFAIPGFLTTMETVKWACENLPHLTAIDIGDGHHYIQEGNPIGLRNALRQWYKEKISEKSP